MENTCELKATKNYMINRYGTVCACVEAPDVVESEMLIYCTADGQEIPFCFSNGDREKIIAYQEVMKCIGQSIVSA